jgi:two-component system sensor histidine kinase/response regulator
MDTRGGSEGSDRAAHGRDGSPSCILAADRPALDAKVVQELRELGDEGDDDGSVHFLEELVALFDAEVGRNVVELEVAIEQADRGAVQRIARSVNGCAVQVGAVIAAEICRRIEAAGAAGRVDGRATELQDLRRELTRAGAALRAELLVAAGDSVSPS